MADKNEGNQPMAAASKVKINAKDFAAKYKSKREVYNFLSVDVGVYLPAYGKYYSNTILTSVQIQYRASHDLLPEGHHARPKMK